MEFNAQIDIYCERLSPAFWAEPINALTNAAFLIAALWAGARLRGAGLPRGMALAGLLFAIGVGSFLFHSVATVWAAIADVTPIVLFVLTYVFALHRDILGLSLGLSWLSVPGFVAFAGLTGAGFAALPFFEISASYWPILPALVIYAYVTRARRAFATGLLVAAGLLVLSLTARSVDMVLCDSLPFGTHFLWHLLNAVLLGWLIDIYRRQMLAGPRPQG